MQKVWIIWSPFCVSILKVLSTQFLHHSLDFNDSALLRSTFLRVVKFLQIKERGPNFWDEPILKNVWIIWSPLLYFNFEGFLDPNSSSFIRLQCILHDSGVLFSEFWNFYKLKRGDVISGVNQFCRMSELFGPPFCILILKVFQTQILCHSLDFNLFCTIQEYILFSESSNCYKLNRGDLISRGNQFCRMLKLFGPPFCILILKKFSRPKVFVIP